MIKFFQNIEQRLQQLVTMTSCMKKYLTIILLLCCSMVSHAQYGGEEMSINESTLYYGLRLGVDFANFSGDGTGNYGKRTGMTLGGIVGMRFSEDVPICAETGLYYTQRGGIRKIKADHKERTSLIYLELPVLIKYGFQPADNLSILPLLGPYFSLGIGGKILDKTEETSISSFKERYNRFDMGFKVGCGAEYNHIYLELGYQFGVANISKDEMNAIHGNAWFINIGVNLY